MFPLRLHACPFIGEQRARVIDARTQNQRPVQRGEHAVAVVLDACMGALNLRLDRSRPIEDRRRNAPPFQEQQSLLPLPGVGLERAALVLDAADDGSEFVDDGGRRAMQRPQLTIAVDRMERFGQGRGILREGIELRVQHGDSLRQLAPMRSLLEIRERRALQVFTRRNPRDRVGDGRGGCYGGSGRCGCGGSCISRIRGHAD